MELNRITRSDGVFDVVFTDGGDAGGDPGSKGDVGLEVEIDGEKKMFTVADVTNLISQQASATQKTQQVSSVLKACEKFGLEPDAFVDQAQGAFSVISDLIEKGLVDEKGNLVEKKGGTGINFPSAGNSNALPAEDKLVGLVAKALEPIIKKLGVLEQDQTQLTRLRISDSVKGKFKNLEDTDISKLFAVAGNDRSKTLMQHAEEISKQKVKEHSNLRGEFAKEFGVDLTRFDANKLNEQSADGGAGALFQGKKFSFKKKEGAITPKEATAEYLDRMR